MNQLQRANRGPCDHDRSRFRLLGLVALFVASLVATYFALSAGLPGAFLIDDSIRIENKDIPRLDLASLARAIESTDVGLLGRPISLASLFTTKFIYGYQPAPFKHENILLHLLTGLMIFWLIYRLMISPVFRQYAPSHLHRTAYATIATTIWLVHPLQVSTVLYVVQRMTILSTLFTIAALLAYTAARQNFAARPVVAFSLVIATAASALLGVLSKEDSALIPIYILLIEVFAFRFTADTQRERRLLHIVVTIFIVVPLFLGGLYFVTHIDSLFYDYAVRQFDLMERLATQTVVMWRYVALLLMPTLSGMSLYHDAIPIHTFGSAWSIAALSGWVLVLLFLLVFRNRYPLLVFGCTFFLASHLMESTVIPLELMFEHRNYLGSMGLFLAVTDLLVRGYARLPKGPAIIVPAISVLLILLLFQSTVRSDVWSDKEKLLLVTVSDHPESDRAASVLANMRLEQRQLETARHILRVAIDRPPHRARPGLRLHLLGTYCLQPQSSSPPAELYNAALTDLQTKPIHAYVLSALNVMRELTKANRCPGIAAADLVPLFEAAGNNPNGRRSNQFRANSLAGLFLTDNGRFAEAADAYQRALVHGDGVPQSARIRTLIDLADLQIELKRLEEASDTIDSTERLLQSGPIVHPAAMQAVRNQKRVLHNMKTD